MLFLGGHFDPDSPGHFQPDLHGHFDPDLPGHFRPFSGGHFAPASSGHFHRFFHFNHIFYLENKNVRILLLNVLNLQEKH